MSKAHQSLILLSKTMTAPWLNGQLLELRWMDGRTGLCRPALWDPNAWFCALPHCKDVPSIYPQAWGMVLEDRGPYSL